MCVQGVELSFPFYAHCLKVIRILPTCLLHKDISISATCLVLKAHLVIRNILVALGLSGYHWQHTVFKPIWVSRYCLSLCEPQVATDLISDIFLNGLEMSKSPPLISNSQQSVCSRRAFKDVWPSSQLTL